MKIDDSILNSDTLKEALSEGMSCSEELEELGAREHERLRYWGNLVISGYMFTQPINVVRKNPFSVNNEDLTEDELEYYFNLFIEALSGKYLLDLEQNAACIRDGRAIYTSSCDRYRAVLMIFVVMKNLFL